MLRAKIFLGLIVAIPPCTLALADDSDFAGGTEVLSLSGGWTQPIRYSEGGITSVNFTWGKYLWQNNSLSLDLGGMFAEQPHGNDEVWIGSVGVLARWHFWNIDRWSIFLDGGGGVSYADDQYPTYRYDGTHFNFYGKVGLGASLELKSREYLTGGVRYFHMSNGQIHGKDQNPGQDGLQYWLGLMWTR